MTKVCKISPAYQGQNERQVRVLGMPFGHVDSYNTFFSERTSLLHEFMPHYRLPPVYDYHGLDGTMLSSLPVGQTLDTWVDESGRWWLVEFYEGAQNLQDYVRAASECNLYASVGMLRAGMFPKPPAATRGVFGTPTELVVAPVVELSVIVGDPSTGRLPANYYAQGGYEFVEVETRSRAANSNRRKRKMLTPEQLSQLATSLGAAAAMLNTAVAASVGDEAAPVSDDVRAALEAAQKPLIDQAKQHKDDADALRAQLAVILGKQNDEAVNGVVASGLLAQDDADTLRAVLGDLDVARNADLRELLSKMGAAKAAPSGAGDEAAQRAAAFTKQIVKAGDDASKDGSGKGVDPAAMNQYRNKWAQKGLKAPASK